MRVASHISKDGRYSMHPDKFQFSSLTVGKTESIQTISDYYYYCSHRTVLSGGECRSNIAYKADRQCY